MAGPIDSIYPDGSAVSKGSVRSFDKSNHILVVSDASEVASSDLSNQRLVMLSSTGRIYKIATGDTTTPPDGLTFLRDINSIGFRAVVFDGIDGVDGTSALSVVRVVATSNITIASGLAAGSAIDGVTLAMNDLILLTGQSTPALNGVYVVPSAGAAARAAAFSAYNSHPGRYFSIAEGAVGADRLYRCTSNVGGTLGTTALIFAEFGTLAAQRASGPNRTPNCNVQLNSRVLGRNFASDPSTHASTLRKEDGTGFVPIINITSLDPSTGNPRLFTANTQDLIAGQLVHFGDAVHSGLTNYPGASAGQTWASRLAGVVTNTLISLDHLPFGTQSPGSSALNCYPVGIFQGDGGYAADGHFKDPFLHYWPDDWPSNRCPGAKRVVGFYKNTAAAQRYGVALDEGDFGEVRGRNIVIGFRVYHKSSAGPGTSCAFIDDGVSEVVSASATGPTYYDSKYGPYEMLYVAATPSMSMTKLEYGMKAQGPAAQVGYMALLTRKYGDVMQPEDLGQEPGELIKGRTHWNPYFSVPFTGSTPNVDIVTGTAPVGSGSGSYGWRDLDIEALGFGQVHNSVKWVNCKIEFGSTDGAATAAGLQVFVGNYDFDGNLTFGPQAIVQSATAIDVHPMALMPLGKGTNGRIGTFAIYFSQHDYQFSITFDFDDVVT